MWPHMYFHAFDVGSCEVSAYRYLNAMDIFDPVPYPLPAD